MRFYQQPHAFYAGIDLHARSIHATERFLGRALPNSPGKRDGREPSARGNTCRPDPVRLFGAASVF